MYERYIQYTFKSKTVNKTRTYTYFYNLYIIIDVFFFKLSEGELYCIWQVRLFIDIKWGCP